MQVRIRGNVVHLVVSRYVPLDKATGKGGRNISRTVAKFDANATEIPQDLPVTLSDDDLEKIMCKAIMPARERERRRIELETVAKEAAAAHAIDPNWRLKNAEEILNDVLRVVGGRGPATDFERLSSLFAMCTQIGIIDSPSATNAPERVAEVLMVISRSILEVARKVDGYEFQVAEDTNVKDASLYKAWMAISSARQSLQESLQKKRYVQSRAPKAREL